MPNLNLEQVLGLRDKIRNILLTVGIDVVPLSLIFQNLGYTGLTGVGWGVLIGFISGIGGELGFEVRKEGSKYFLKRQRGGEKDGKE